MQSLGGVLAKAAQGAPYDGGSWSGRGRASGRQSKQRATSEALKEFIIERHDRLVATRIALAGGPSKQLTVDTTRLVVFRQDDMQAAGAAHGGM